MCFLCAHGLIFPPVLALWLMRDILGTGELCLLSERDGRNDGHHSVKTVGAFGASGRSLVWHEVGGGRDDGSTRLQVVCRGGASHRGGPLRVIAGFMGASRCSVLGLWGEEGGEEWG